MKTNEKAGVVLAAVVAILAAIPSLLFRANLRVYRPPPLARLLGEHGDIPKVSVLMPARNAEYTVGHALAAVLASKGVDLEVIVLDDQSDDATAEVVSSIADQDRRLRLVRGQPLPPGWCG